MLTSRQHIPKSKKQNTKKRTYDLTASRRVTLSPATAKSLLLLEEEHQDEAEDACPDPGSTISYPLNRSNNEDDGALSRSPPLPQFMAVDLRTRDLIAPGHEEVQEDFVESAEHLLLPTDQEIEYNCTSNRPSDPHQSEGYDEATASAGAAEHLSDSSMTAPSQSMSEDVEIMGCRTHPDVGLRLTTGVTVTDVCTEETEAPRDGREGVEAPQSGNDETERSEGEIEEDGRTEGDMEGPTEAGGLGSAVSADRGGADTGIPEEEVRVDLAESPLMQCADTSLSEDIRETAAGKSMVPLTVVMEENGYLSPRDSLSLLQVNRGAAQRPEASTALVAVTAVREAVRVTDMRLANSFDEWGAMARTAQRRAEAKRVIRQERIYNQYVWEMASFHAATVARAKKESEDPLENNSPRK